MVERDFIKRPSQGNCSYCFLIAKKDQFYDFAQKPMIVATTLIELLPIMLSSGVGSDVMKPIAAPSIGGMLTSAIHVLLVTPIMFTMMKERPQKR